MEACFRQAGHEVRFDWGPDGLRAVGAGADVIVIVDVLSFTTCVAVAVARGARVFPYIWKDERAAAFARERGAELAGKRGSGARVSLSPASLAGLAAGEAVVLPSPNGSQLSTMTGGALTFAGCLRNATATAEAARARGGHIAVIAAGERWHDNERLRPSLEDLLGAGAIIAAIGGRTKSPEARLAEEAWRACAHGHAAMIEGCASGRELTEAGYPEDVALAIEHDASDVPAVLRDGAYEGLKSRPA